MNERSQLPQQRAGSFDMQWSLYSLLDDGYWVTTTSPGSPSDRFNAEIRG